ncbi:hypothetical protein [Paenibacillus mendelii]|uniref:Uncharacterized protein n=1 Tax=Paenibacillus mendelii TaxID=206163 RepID=A0ABV6JPI2_9BACL|nr:hypothetical protein [Paenibacillus mendelii]MCQ6563040.1 hypothetical protein [Paenibacillus mendelii]
MKKTVLFITELETRRTNQALFTNEEKGRLDVTTMAVGEEGGDIYTTMAIGEEGGC